jgi:hypothetical protein
MPIDRAFLEEKCKKPTGKTENGFPTYIWDDLGCTEAEYKLIILPVFDDTDLSNDLGFHIRCLTRNAAIRVFKAISIIETWEKDKEASI